MSLPLLDVVVVVDSSWVIAAVSGSIADASIANLYGVYDKESISVSDMVK